MTSGEIDQALPPRIAALVDFFFTDERPTYVLLSHSQSSEHPHTAIANPALENFLASQSHGTFASWADGVLETVKNSEYVQRVQYLGQEWACKWLRSDDCVVLYAAQWTGLPHAEVKRAQEEKEAVPALITENHYDNPDETTWVVDWTRFPCAAVTPWTQYLRDFAWEKTDVGPMEHWSPYLRQSVVEVMATPLPRAIHWGKDGFAFFNEAARPLLGSQNELILGNRIKSVLDADTTDMHIRVLRDALKTGRTDTTHRATYTLDRHGAEQDFYFDINTLPLCGLDGRLCGKAFDVREVTDAVLEDRRNRLTSNLLECLATTKTLEQLWSGLLKTFKESQSYLPCVLVYANTDDTSDGTVSEESDASHNLKLQGVIGIGSEQIPVTINTRLQSEMTHLARTVSEASRSIEIKVLRLKTGTFPPELAVMLQDGRVADTGCVLCIQGREKGSVAGCIIVGFNTLQPFRPEDVELIKFVRGTVSRCAIAISRATDGVDKNPVPTDISFGSAELRLLMADRQMNAFVKLARNAPCGMFVMNLDGSPKFLNDKYFELTGFTSIEQVTEISRTRSFWSDMLSEEDARKQAVAAADSHFAQQLLQAGSMQSEHRLLYPLDPSNPDAPRHFHRWIDCVTFPEVDAENNIQALMGFITDITDRKCAEESQIEREKEVQAEQLRTMLANKKAADEFIDTVCHELRNPLSAVFQLADDIVSIIGPLTTNPLIAETIASVVDATSTIVLCTQHMKTIVDDILTLSKLDSNLLTLSLESARPDELAMQALKFYEAEARAAEVTLSLRVDESYHKHNVCFVILDHGRTLQILLNLVSNAIKFTKTSSTRTITLSLEASTTRPSEQSSDLRFAPLEAPSNVTEPVGTIPQSPRSSEPTPNELYIQFAVSDTGRGIAQDELVRLFKKSFQGSAKTYTQYGGSGLGLFISKRLSELQGGQIGVKSDGLGLGTTFAFYIKVKRSGPEPRRNSLPKCVKPEPSPKPTNAKISTESRREGEVVHKQQQLDILIVEDNLVNQKVMARQLRQLGHTVHVANHGAEALEFLTKTRLYRQNSDSSVSSNATNGLPLSVILMDIEMPVMDGLTCTRNIRKLEETGEIIQHIPIIAITANARAEQVTQARESGMDDVVTKPYRLPLLIAAIEGLVKPQPV